MKKLVMTLAFVLLLTVCILPGVTRAEGSVAISQENFPDAALRRYLSKEYDKDGDGVLSELEIKAVTKIMPTSEDVPDLRGIEYFYNLEMLYVNYSGIREVDLSGNPKLKELYIQGNSLTTLDLSHNPQLTYVSCSYNGTLKELNLTGCTKIKTLHCGYNQLQSLDVSHITALEYLSCEDNGLQVLKLGYHPYLYDIEAPNNQIRQLDTSRCSALTHLTVNLNRIEYLDLSKATKLQYLYANSNSLTRLDLDNCSVLHRALNCGSTYTISLTGDTFDLSTLPGGFNTAKASNWVGGTVSGNILTVDADATCVTYDYNCGQNVTAYFTLLIDSRQGDAPSVAISATNFPDYYLREYLTEYYDEDNNGQLSLAERLRVSKIGYASRDYNSLAGIGNLPNLEFIIIYGSNLTQLDLSNNHRLVYIDLGANSLRTLDVSGQPNLNYLGVSDNGLTQLNVTGCTKLKRISASENNLTALDVSSQTLLDSLDLTDNQITSLDLGSNTKLTSLTLDENQLTSLDVSGCSSLKSLRVNNNQLTGIYLSNCSKLYFLDLRNNQITNLDLYYNTQIQYLYVSGNRLSSLDTSRMYGLSNLDTANNRYEIDLQGGTTFDLATLPGSFQVSKASNWVGGTVSGNRLTILDSASIVTFDYQCSSKFTASFALDVVGRLSDMQVTLDSANFPDSVFRAYVSENYDTDSNGILDYYELAAVNQLLLYGDNIYTLQGVEHFFNLEYLDCSATDITQLDVTKNNKLTSLSFARLNITEIDLSGNPKLDYLECSNTMLTALDVSGCPNLATLHCDESMLESLDVSCCPELTLLSAQKNQLRSLIIGNHTNMWYINCQENQLQTLDVSGCPNLQRLFADVNELTAIDLANNPYLVYLDLAANQLTNLDLTNMIQLTSFGCAGNVFAVETDAQGFLDVNRLPGSLDMSRVTDVTGAAVVNGGFQLEDGSSQIVYTYQCSDQYAVEFTLLCTRHVHSFGQWQRMEEPDCTNPGYEVRWCDSCGQEEGRSVEALGHRFTVEKKNATSYCPQCERCGFNNETDAKNTPTWESGTIASANGQNNVDGTRLRTTYYLLLSDYVGVGIDFGYIMTNFVYDADKNYLGTSSWLGSGQNFTTADLLEKYPTGVYFRIALRTRDSRTLTVADAAASGVTFYGPGQDIPVLESDVKYTNVGSIGAWQDGAIFNDKLFVLGGSGTGAVYDLVTSEKLGTLTLDKKDILKPHANSVCFGSAYYAEEDMYPLLYVNIYNNYKDAANRMEGTCCVYRLTETEGVFTTQLVQVIRIGFTEDLTLWKSKENNGDVRPYGNFVVDTDSGKLYAFTMRDANKTTRFFRFAIPAIGAGTYNETYGCNVVTLNADDIESQFDTAYFNYLQGVTYYDGKIISAEGFKPDPAVRIVDLETQSLMGTYYPGEAGVIAEAELLCVDPDTGLLYYAAADGVLRELILPIHLVHLPVTDPAVAPTCTTTGLTEGSHCSVCGEIIVEQEVVDALGHDYKSVVTDPTCTEQGYTTHTCFRCGDSYVDTYVEATGHTYGEWVEVNAATCTAEGSEKRTCHCGHEETRAVAALGHDYQATVTEPTCTEQGYTTHTCSRCGDSYMDTYVDALGHTYGEWVEVTAPTCTAEGSEKRTCHCGHEETRAVAALGHDYQATVTEPTCTEQGYTTHTCSRCGDSYVDTYVDALGHNDETVLVPPSGEEYGGTRHTCSACGYSFLKAFGDGWVQIDGNWYRYKAGVPLTGWQKAGGKWYYLKADYVMATGWVRTGGKWYYLSSSGAMQTGWQKVAGVWYYLKPSGAMVTGAQEVNGKLYFFNASGAWQSCTGWQKLEGVWYYFDANSVLQTSWLKSGNYWYYLHADGKMATGWLKSGDNWYYLRESGAMKTGWLQLGENWYYLNASGAMASNCTLCIGGVDYTFDANGVWIP